MNFCCSQLSNLQNTLLFILELDSAFGIWWHFTFLPFNCLRTDKQQSCLFARIFNAWKWSVFLSICLTSICFSFSSMFRTIQSHFSKLIFRRFVSSFRFFFFSLSFQKVCLHFGLICISVDCHNQFRGSEFYVFFSSFFQFVAGSCWHDNNKSKIKFHRQKKGQYLFVSLVEKYSWKWAKTAFFLPIAFLSCWISNP